MEVKYTPGPWTWTKPDKWPNHEEHEVWLGSIDHESGTICDFGHNAQYYPSQGEPPNEANARLIAAAPELLEALQALFADYKRLADSGDAGYWSLEDTEEGKLALAAIAKATGAA